MNSHMSDILARCLSTNKSAEPRQTARELATEAEEQRQNGQLFEAIETFELASKALRSDQRRLEAWCLAHRGVAKAALGFLDGPENAFFDLNEAIRIRKLLGSPYAWALGQLGEAHRLHARDQLSEPNQVASSFDSDIALARASFDEAEHDGSAAMLRWLRAHRAATGVLEQWVYDEVVGIRKYPGLANDLVSARKQLMAEFEALGPEPYSWAKQFEALLYFLGDDGDQKRCADLLEQLGSGAARQRRPLLRARALAATYVGRKIPREIIERTRSIEAEDVIASFAIALVQCAHPRELGAQLKPQLDKLERARDQIAAYLTALERMSGPEARVLLDAVGPSGAQLIGGALRAHAIKTLQADSEDVLGLFLLALSLKAEDSDTFSPSRAGVYEACVRKLTAALKQADHLAAVFDETRMKVPPSDAIGGIPLEAVSLRKRTSGFLEKLAGDNQTT